MMLMMMMLVERVREDDDDVTYCSFCFILFFCLSVLLVFNTLRKNTRNESFAFLFFLLLSGVGLVVVVVGGGWGVPVKLSNTHSDRERASCLAEGSAFGCSAYHERRRETECLRRVELMKSADNSNDDDDSAAVGNKCGGSCSQSQSRSLSSHRHRLRLRLVVAAVGQQPQKQLPRESRGSRRNEGDEEGAKSEFCIMLA